MKLSNLKSLALSFSVLLAVAILFPACQDDGVDPGPVIPTIPNNLSETLKTLPDFSTLVEALEAASLTTQLDGAPVTIFAPTNAAFDTFLTNAGYPSVGDVPIGELKNLLLNHVLDGYSFFSDLSNGYVNTLATVEFDGLIYPVDMGVNVDDFLLNGSAGVKDTDIDGVNGIIHTVDQVITPADVADLANSAGNLGNLVESLATVNLVNSLQTDGPFTVFAPTDDALQWSTSMGLDLELLEAILALHVVDGNIRSEDLFDDQLIDNFSFIVDGTDTYTIRFGADGTTQIVETGSNPERIIARITMADIQAANGVIHLIDNVIIL